MRYFDIASSGNNFLKFPFSFLTSFVRRLNSINPACLPSHPSLQLTSFIILSTQPTPDFFYVLQLKKKDEYNQRKHSSLAGNYVNNEDLLSSKVYE